MIAEFFVVLLLLLLLDDRIRSNAGKLVCFVIFSFALVTSHYSLAELLFFFISVVLVYFLVMKRPSKNMTMSIVMLFFVIMFTWYIFVSSSASFESLLGFGQHLRNQLDDFLNLASRGQGVLRGLGIEAAPSILNLFSRVSAYAVQFLIVVGFLGLISRFIKIRISRELYALILIAMAFLAGLILVPGLANALNMYRFYHFLLFFLAPLSVLGTGILVRLVFKKERATVVSLVLLVILVAYFLFQTGFAYEITRNDTFSFQMSIYRMNPVRLFTSSGYVDALSMSGAQWSSRNLNVPATPVYCDWVSISILEIYARLYGGYLSGLSNTTALEPNGIVCLSTLNVIHEIVVSAEYSYNVSGLSSQLDYFDTVYDNGGSHIYKNPQG
jgi:uncharacterized membrane protein